MEGTTTENLPRRIGRYDIAALVAGGGSPIGSEIFLATDSLRGGGRPAILKRVASSLTKDATRVSAYVGAAQEVAKRLRHPNVVEIRAVHGDDREVVLVMDYLQGETLARFVRQLHETGATLPTTTAAYIVAEACAGLDAAHRAGFVHGLLTPYDLFIGYDGTVKVLDIGISGAKAALAGEEEAPQVRDAEMQYSSPESCRGETPDRRSDVFSLGAILWELLTGVSPFERAERAATIRAICDEPIASPEQITRSAALPGRIAETTMNALERDPEKRCPEAGKLRQLLLGHVGADKPARAELARLMQKAFEGRKADKEKVVAKLAEKPPSKDLAGLDFTDETIDLHQSEHPADLDAKIPSGIAASTGGKVEIGPSIVVVEPQPTPRARKNTAPMSSLNGPSPFALTPSAKPPALPAQAPPVPSIKPPRVPFYEEEERARRAREEPTSLVGRASQRISDPPPPAPPQPQPQSKKGRGLLVVVVGAILGVAVTVAVLAFATKSKPVAATPPPPLPPSSSAALEAPSAAASATPIETAAPPVVASASASPPAQVADKTVLSIDTVPTHATVLLDGKKMGTTPLELKVPTSHDEVTVEIQHAGYATLKERVVPDMNQRLKLNLLPSGAKPTSAKPVPKDPYRKFE